MVGQVGPSSESQRWRTTSIQILGDDLLLKIFKHCRPVFLDQERADQDSALTLEEGKWDHERWWYTLAHVCRRWRCLLLTSASHLDLCLFFTHGAPVVDMLAHSPPLPLVIDYGEEDPNVTAEDEEGILLALQRRRRVHRIRLHMPALTLRKLVVALNGEFPMLEYLYIKSLTDDDGLILPETFRAPHLRHFALRHVTYSPAMIHLQHPTPRVQAAKRSSLCVQRGDSQTWRSLRAFIYILDDDSLLNIFYLCRPFLLYEDEWSAPPILRGGEWDLERWWYKLARVCRKWRYLILASASHLHLSLHCTFDTPVADMLENSPPFPLTINYLDENRNITVEDVTDIELALHHCDRVRRIRLLMPAPDLEKLIVSMDEEFPILEYLYIDSPIKHNTRLIFPETFQAPHLRHLILINFAFPIGSPLLTTAVGLVTLSLLGIHPSVYVHPRDLLQRLSLMPQLETLWISFHSPIRNRDIETRLVRMPVTTNVTLPNLRWFAFGGASAYLEALLPHITAPLLENLQIHFFGQLTFSVPCLLQFMGTLQSIRLTHVDIVFFSDAVFVKGYLREGVNMEVFFLCLGHEYFDWQVASVAQLLNALGTAMSAVESLVLQFPRKSMNREADHTQWHALLMPFNNVKSLRVADSGGFVDGGRFLTQLSDFLELDDRESPMELLPELKELYSPGYYVDDTRTFSAFLDGRKNAGRPVTQLPN